MGRGDTVALGLVLTLIMVPLAGEESSDLIRHFLIESSTKGVHLKGASEELYFGKDSAVAHSSPGSPRSCFQSPWKHQAGPGECVAHLPAQEPPSPWSCLHFPDSGTVAVAPKQEHELPGMFAGWRCVGGGFQAAALPQLTVLVAGSLSAFVYQHSITPLALPCKLSIPTRGR